MISLTVSAVDGEAVLYGLTANDLQSDIAIGDNSISGTLSYIPSYPKFSSVSEQQSGYYLALSFSANPEAAITTELVNGTNGAVTVTDGFCVYRITDKENQKIRVSAERNGKSVAYEYSLKQLFLGDWILDSGRMKVLDSNGEFIQAQQSESDNR